MGSGNEHGESCLILRFVKWLGNTIEACIPPVMMPVESNRYAIFLLIYDCYFLELLISC